MIYLGSFINAGLVIIGTIFGLLLKKAISTKLQEILFQCCGLITLYLGFSMAGEMKNLIIIAFSLMLGAIVGEYLSLENKFERFGDKLKSRLANNENSFTQGFVAATMLYCVGSMAIIGAMDGALRNNHSILITKGILDGFMSIVFTSTYGIGVIFSIFPAPAPISSSKFFACSISIFVWVAPVCISTFSKYSFNSIFDIFTYSSCHM